MSIERIQIGEVGIGRGLPLAVIAGPCVIESREHLLRMADGIASVCRRHDVPLVFKASFDKANRTSVDSFRGPGLEDGCAMLRAAGESIGAPVTTDIHLPEQAPALGEAVDCIQIPAFLCRQTDLLIAAARTQRCVNIKKGQFMSPEEMGEACRKVAAQDNPNVMLTERGTFFGYNRLVNDVTALPRMRVFAPVCFDATHSCQQPGGRGTSTGGAREFLPALASAAVAAGVDALFLEVHDDPDHAKSDAATQWPLERFESLLTRLLRIRAAIAD